MESAMESLPEELLVMVLSLVRDARTLLDVVPLVCRRWHRVARDPRAWDGALLPLFHRVVEGEMLIRVDDARLLLHAPAEGRLWLCLGRQGLDPFPAGVPTVPLERVLDRCCSARVGHLSAHSGVDDIANHGDVDEALARLVEANAEHLETVQLSVDFEELDPTYYDVQLPYELESSLRGCRALRSAALPASALGVLAEAAPGLAHLDLELCHDTELPDLDGWPEGGQLPAMPALRRLTLNFMDSAPEMPSWTGVLLLSLCRAAPGLERLRLTCPSGDLMCYCNCQVKLPLPELMACLPALRRLEAHCEPALLAALVEQPPPALAELRLDVKCHNPDCVDDSVLRHLCELRLLRPNLRTRINLHATDPVTLKLKW